MPEQQIDRVESILGGHGDAAIEDLRAAGCAPRSRVVVRERDGWLLTTIATPVAAARRPGEDARLTGCHKDCLKLLARQKGVPISGVLAYRAMKKDPSIGPHGEATVKRAMADLKR